MSNVFYRLPTEAEWEYACRAGTKTAYSFGDDTDSIDEYAWHYDNSDDMYHDVGQKKPNAFGLHDMHGNVSEIVLDQYQEDSYQKKATTVDESVVWTEKMFPHTIRGGSWADDPPALRSAARGQTESWREEDPNLPKSPWWFTDEPALSVGFRLIRPLVAPESAKERARYWEIDNEELRQAVEDRLAEGRGVQGVVDTELPKLVEEKNK
jgi:formylglycine-generating enzyme required for sulfatase activity